GHRVSRDGGGRTSAASRRGWGVHRSIPSFAADRGWRGPTVRWLIVSPCPVEPPAQRSASAAQSVTTFALGRLLNPGLEHPSLALTDEGHLMVTVQGEVMARTEALLLCSQNLDARPLNRRMQGRAVPEVF